MLGRIRKFIANLIISSLILGLVTLAYFEITYRLILLLPIVMYPLACWTMFVVSIFITYLVLLKTSSIFRSTTKNSGNNYPNNNNNSSNHKSHNNIRTVIQWIIKKWSIVIKYRIPSRRNSTFKKPTEQTSHNYNIKDTNNLSYSIHNIPPQEINEAIVPSYQPKSTSIATGGKIVAWDLSKDTGLFYQDFLFFSYLPSPLVSIVGWIYIRNIKRLKCLC